MATTNELRAAAKDIIAEYGPRDGQLGRTHRNALTLARAWLAGRRPRTPADDGEVVTEDWLRSVGFEDSVDLTATAPTMLAWEYGEPHFHIRFILVDTDHWGCEIKKIGSRWSDGVGFCRPGLFATRGHVRALAKCLGIPLAE
jgi:hypothetical protein